MDREAFVRQAAELVPVLRERAPQAEALRCVPQETIDDLGRADLLRVPVPERFGGCGLDVDLIPSVAAELGRGCGSTAWCYGIWTAGNWAVGMYPMQAQEEYWATGANTLCANSLNPAGATSVTAVAGGYRLSGQWDFASGCDAATWVLVMGAGPAGVLMFLVPRSDFAIHDTWFVSGLRGTGSKDIVIHDAFVPAHRVLPATDMQEARTPGRVIHDTANYRIPSFSASGYALAAPLVGMAQGAVETFQASMQHQASGPPGWADGSAHRRPGAVSGGHHGGGGRASDHAARYARDPGTGTARRDAHAGRTPAHPAQPGVCGHAVRAGSEPPVRREWGARSV